jgi:hypothetical protein
MTSVITPRTGTVPGGSPIAGIGTGIYQTSNVAGVNALTCDVFPDISEYVTNRLYLIRPPVDNTGAMTIDISGEGARAWVKPDGSAFATGEVFAALDYLIKDNGTHFRTITPSF